MCQGGAAAVIVDTGAKRTAAVSLLNSTHPHHHCPVRILDTTLKYAYYIPILYSTVKYAHYLLILCTTVEYTIHMPIQHTHTQHHCGEHKPNTTHCPVQISDTLYSIEMLTMQCILY